MMTSPCDVTGMMGLLDKLGSILAVLLLIVNSYSSARSIEMIWIHMDHMVVFEWGMPETMVFNTKMVYARGPSPIAHARLCKVTNDVPQMDIFG